jgi:hypothetical protein
LDKLSKLLYKELINASSHEEIYYYIYEELDDGQVNVLYRRRGDIYISNFDFIIFGSYLRVDEVGFPEEVKKEFVEYVFDGDYLNL